MKLYQHPLSANARRAVMTALHLEIPVELVLVDLAKGSQRDPAYLALNPNGRVPTLEDGDFVLTESHAIMQYLADGSPRGEELYPRDAKSRALVHQWQFWNAHHFQPAVGTLNFEHLIKTFRGLGDPDPAEVQRGERLFHDCARVLGAHLAKQPWLVGGGLTLADISVATPLMAIHTARLPIAEYTSVLRWLDRVRALPAWQRTDPPRP